MYNDEGVIAGFLGYDDAIETAEGLSGALLVEGVMARLRPFPIEL